MDTSEHHYAPPRKLLWAVPALFFVLVALGIGILVAVSAHQRAPVVSEPPPTTAPRPHDLRYGQLAEARALRQKLAARRNQPISRSDITALMRRLPSDLNENHARRILQVTPAALTDDTLLSAAIAGIREARKPTSILPYTVAPHELDQFLTSNGSPAARIYALIMGMDRKYLDQLPPEYGPAAELAWLRLNPSLLQDAAWTQSLLKQYPNDPAIQLLSVLQSANAGSVSDAIAQYAKYDTTLPLLDITPELRETEFQFLRDMRALPETAAVRWALGMDTNSQGTIAYSFDPTWIYEVTANSLLKYVHQPDKTEDTSTLAAIVSELRYLSASTTNPEQRMSRLLDLESSISVASRMARDPVLLNNTDTVAKPSPSLSLTLPSPENIRNAMAALAGLQQFGRAFLPQANAEALNSYYAEYRAHGAIEALRTLQPTHPPD